MNLYGKHGTCKNEFSQDIINSLQKSASQLEAISEFIEEDFGYIDTQDDADETIGRLYPLIELTEGLAVAGRINKEIRELVERKSSLPPRTLKQHETELKNIINKLNANAPTCKRKNCALMGSVLTLQHLCYYQTHGLDR